MDTRIVLLLCAVHMVYGQYAPVNVYQYNDVGVAQTRVNGRVTASPQDRVAAEKIYDEMARLAGELAQELQPIGGEYQSLWTKFTRLLNIYTSRFVQRVNGVIMGAEGVDNGVIMGEEEDNGVFEETNSLANQQDSFKTSEVATAFRDSHLVPDLLTTPPRYTAELSFPSGTHISLGGAITPMDTREPPSMFSWPTVRGKRYSVMMVDVAPGGGGEWIHWLVVDIAGTNIRRGNTLVEYVPAAPPANTGTHRYTFLVFEQPNGRLNDTTMKFVNNRSVGRRGLFLTREFMQRNRLSTPIAGNFYVAECDPFVEQVYAQLGQPSPGKC